MKWLLLIVVALIMLVAITLGGGLGLIMNVKTDVNDPEFAAKFQKGMETVCLQAAKAEIGQTLDYQQEALVKQVCGCSMRETTKILAKKGAKTPVELQKAYNDSTKEVEAAFQTCAQSYGLQ